MWVERWHLGSRLVRAARRAYVRAMKGAREEEWRGESPGQLPWWVHEADRRVEPVEPTAWIDELGRSTGLERPLMEVRDFLSRSCQILNVTLATVAGMGATDHNLTTRSFCGPVVMM